MKLKKLIIKNFKGISHKEIEFSDITEIYGRNATYKTTLYDAFLWCLFGYDSSNQTNFQIKPHNSDRNTKTSVTCILDSITLKKECSEKWTKKRGQLKKQLTGHVIDHFIKHILCRWYSS